MEMELARMEREEWVGVSAELTNIAKLGDDLWVGVKCQTNLDIACSLRNSFRASVVCLV